MTLYHEFDVTLHDAAPGAWRRFQLRSTATFLDLHRAIQDACGWEGGHLFCSRPVPTTGAASQVCPTPRSPSRSRAPRGSH